MDSGLQSSENSGLAAASTHIRCSLQLLGVEPRDFEATCLTQLESRPEYAGWREAIRAYADRISRQDPEIDAVKRVGAVSLASLACSSLQGYLPPDVLRPLEGVANPNHLDQLVNSAINRASPQGVDVLGSIAETACPDSISGLAGELRRIQPREASDSHVQPLSAWLEKLALEMRYVSEGKTAAHSSEADRPIGPVQQLLKSIQPSRLSPFITSPGTVQGQPSALVVAAVVKSVLEFLGENDVVVISPVPFLSRFDPGQMDRTASVPPNSHLEDGLVVRVDAIGWKWAPKERGSGTAYVAHHVVDKAQVAAYWKDR